MPTKNGKYLLFLKELGFKTTGIDSSPTAIVINPGVDMVLPDPFNKEISKTIAKVIC